MSLKKNLKNIILTSLGAGVISTGAMAQEKKSATKDNKQPSKTEVRAWEMPHPDTTNTIYVGSSILGVSAVNTVVSGQAYSFDVNTEPGFNKKDFNLKAESYPSYDKFLEDFRKRIEFYGKNPKLQSRIARDKVAFEEVKSRAGYRLSSKDTAMTDSLKVYLSDLFIDRKESYELAKMVSDMGKDNVLTAINISHAAGTTKVKGKNGKYTTVKVPGESIPVVLNIPHLVQQATKYVAVHDTIKADNEKLALPQSAPKNRLRHYVGFGVEANKFNNQKISKIIPEFKVGVADDRLGIGIVAGYKNNLKEHKGTPFPKNKVDGSTSYTMDITTKTAHFGLEGKIFNKSKTFGFDIGVDYNIVKSDTTGTKSVYHTKTENHWVVDDNNSHNKSYLKCGDKGHWETTTTEDTIKTPIHGSRKFGFPTINLGIEKYVKKGDFSVSVSAKIPVFESYWGITKKTGHVSDISGQVSIVKYF
jgi:hypothetical protein